MRRVPADKICAAISVRWGILSRSLADGSLDSDGMVTCDSDDKQTNSHYKALLTQIIATEHIIYREKENICDIYLKDDLNSMSFKTVVHLHWYWVSAIFDDNLLANIRLYTIITVIMPTAI